ncbi:MAG: anaerobic ribonucleoside triphosphate reductase [Prevotella sp.]|nr:anaerobic ribonucleoside triphosphate reductase [Prevotella sp.]MDY5289793.1 anaerobic ribonucleoside triphosphate reductase [Prevotella sp.]
MVLKVRKRDGRVVDFNPVFISNAIKKAMNEVGDIDYFVADSIANQIKVNGDYLLDVDSIQVMVENSLMQSSLPDIARAYIIYRHKRDKARKSKSNEVLTDIIAAKKNDITRENANMNADTPAGMMMKVASERTKEYVDEFLLSDDVRKLVDDNILHVHDKDYYPTKSLTCLQHPVDKLLNEGFRAGHGESRPAKRIETASILSCISMEAIQNEMHGGQAIPAFDFYLAPFVRKTYIEEVEKIEEFLGADFSDLYDSKIDDYLFKELDDMKCNERVRQHAINQTVERVHQAMEAFIHNMNTIHSRGGNQVVFSSINYGTDTSAEGRCIIRELLLSTYNGVGNHATAIFPIQIWKKKRGVSFLPGDPNYDLFKLACKVTAKRFFPNFVNLDAPFNKSDKWRADDPKRYMYEVATMGCRTRVFEDRFGDSQSVGRGNLSFSTVNLPGLALSVMDIADDNDRLKAFFEKLTYAIDITGKQLYERYEFQCTALTKQFPLLMSGMWVGSENLKPDDEVRDVLKHGTLGVGFIGLAECLIALCGHHHGESAEAQKLGLKIITFMRDKTKELSDKYDLNYSVFSTPAEGLSGKFTKKDRKKYGVVPGVTDKDYYTNSNHIPVYYKCSADFKARIEAPYHDLTRGGHIFYVELDGDATHNVEAVEQIVELMDKYNIGYGSINHNRNRCLDCSYEDASANLEVCPVCGSHNIDKLQRITGYLVGTTDRWNSGKLAELHDRVTHGV